MRNSERRVWWPLLLSLKLEAQPLVGTDECGSESWRVRMKKSESAPVGNGNGNGN